MRKVNKKIVESKIDRNALTTPRHYNLNIKSSLIQKNVFQILQPIWKSSRKCFQDSWIYSNWTTWIVLLFNAQSTWIFPIFHFYHRTKSSFTTYVAVCHMPRDNDHVTSAVPLTIALTSSTSCVGSLCQGAPHNLRLAGRWSSVVTWFDLLSDSRTVRADNWGSLFRPAAAAAAAADVTWLHDWTKESNRKRRGKMVTERLDGVCCLAAYSKYSLGRPHARWSDGRTSNKSHRYDTGLVHSLFTVGPQYNDTRRWIRRQ